MEWIYRIYHRGEYKIGKSPTPEGKISIVLFTRLAELENDCNLTQGCRRFPYLVLFPVFDSISHIFCYWWWWWFMVFSATFNNISVIS
jgi:hypothetical protein